MNIRAKLNLNYSKLKYKYMPGWIARFSTRYVRDNYKEDNLICVEIGTWQGHNADSILKVLPVKKLFLIDPFTYMTQFDNESMVRDILLPFEDKYELVKGFWENEYKRFPDNYFDFGYIDADHKYETTLEQMELLLPKIKKGGVMAGHDFSTSHLGVCKAFIEFFEKHEVAVTLVKRSLNEWVVVKK